MGVETNKIKEKITILTYIKDLNTYYISGKINGIHSIVLNRIKIVIFSSICSKSLNYSENFRNKERLDR